MDIERIAAVCHEANRQHCQSIGDGSQLPWDQAPAWQRTSAIHGVAFHIDNPDAGPSGSHENWYRVKEADGWKYGPVKDVAKKEHPCMVPYSQLPPEQRVKDDIFVAIVRALSAIPPIPQRLEE